MLKTKFNIVVQMVLYFNYISGPCNLVAPSMKKKEAYDWRAIIARLQTGGFMLLCDRGIPLRNQVFLQQVIKGHIQ